MCVKFVWFPHEAPATRQPSGEHPHTCTLDVTHRLVWRSRAQAHQPLTCSLSHASSMPIPWQPHHTPTPTRQLPRAHTACHVPCLQSHAQQCTDTQGTHSQVGVVVDMAVDVAAGLSWMHHKGFIHRDIKPQVNTRKNAHTHTHTHTHSPTHPLTHSLTLLTNDTVSG